MARIVYTDREGAAPHVRFHGVEFTDGEEVAVEERHDELLVMAGANPFFEVRDGAGETDKPPGAATPMSRGGLAAASGKPRVVPLSYRGKAQETEWLAGYDAKRRRKPR
jgi:hypothetical protein